MTPLREKLKQVNSIVKLQCLSSQLYIYIYREREREREREHFLCNKQTYSKTSKGEAHGDMEKNNKAVTTDEPQINYRGVKAMPFVIGKKRKGKERKSIILKH